MQKITPCLWFDNQAEEATNFYLSIFKNSKIININHYGKEGPGAEGTVMTTTFLIDSEEFVALNGGSEFQFSPALSLVVNCNTQEEVDYFWDKLSEDGEKQQCGWLTDKYGVSWQVVPVILGEMLSDSDSLKSQRVMKAMLKMKKLDINLLKQAYDRK